MYFFYIWGNRMRNWGFQDKGEQNWNVPSQDEWHLMLSSSLEKCYDKYRLHFENCDVLTLYNCILSVASSLTFVWLKRWDQICWIKTFEKWQRKQVINRGFGHPNSLDSPVSNHNSMILTKWKWNLSCLSWSSPGVQSKGKPAKKVGRSHCPIIHSPVLKTSIGYWSFWARALRALGLLLADGTPTVGGGKTFWAVSQIFLRKQL